MINNFIRTFSQTLLGIAFFVAAVSIDHGIVSAQNNCSDEMEQWTSVFQELRSTVEREANLRNLSVADAIREKAEALGATGKVAAAVRQVISQKRSAWESAQSECLELMDREKTAYKSLSRCVSSGAAKKDASLGTDFRALSKERELALGTFKKAFSDPAFAQYQNQNPPSPSDYENPQDSYYRAFNRGYWGNYAPQSSSSFGR